MMNTTSQQKWEIIANQIKTAMDGRTQRWLSFETRISEFDLSQKMNGATEWKPEEIEKIETRLNFKIEGADLK